MSDLPDLKPDLRELQSLYASLTHRPELLQDLERDFGLRRVDAKDTGTETLAPARLIGMNEFLHARGLPHICAASAALVDYGAGEGMAYFARSCTNLRELLGQLQRWESIWLPGARLTIKTGRDAIEIEMRPRHACPRLGLLMYWEGTWAWLCRLLRASLDAEVPLTNIRVMTPKCEDSSQLSAIFEGPVESDAACFGLCLPTAWLDQPLPGANPGLRHSLSICFALLERRGAEHELRLQVMHCLAQASAPADFSLPQVTDRLGLAAATLRRQLKAKALTFSGLLQAYRRSRVIQDVVQNGVPLGKASLDLGLSSGAALERVGREWWGVSIAQLREDFLCLQGMNTAQDWASPFALPCSPCGEVAPLAAGDEASNQVSAWADPVASAICLGHRSKAGFQAPLRIDANGLLLNPSEQIALQNLQDARQLVLGHQALAPELARRRQCLQNFVNLHAAELKPNLRLLIAWLELGAWLLEHQLGPTYLAVLADSAGLPWQTSLQAERERFGLCRLGAARLLLVCWGVPGEWVKVLQLLLEGATVPQADMVVDAGGLALLSQAMACVNA